jgi:hypothetical protein
MADKAKKETKKPTKFKRNIHGILGAKEIAKPNMHKGPVETVYTPQPPPPPPTKKKWRQTQKSPRCVLNAKQRDRFRLLSAVLEEPSVRETG